MCGTCTLWGLRPLARLLNLRCKSCDPETPAVNCLLHLCMCLRALMHTPPHVVTESSTYKMDKADQLSTGYVTVIQALL